MENLNKEGGLLEDNESPQASPSDKAPQDQIQQPPQTPELPEEFRGKSAEELVKIISERNQTIGRQGEELGYLRNENAYYRQRVPQGGESQQQSAQPVQSPVEDYDWTDPNAVRKVAREETDKAKQEWRFEQARQNFFWGQREAMRSNPELLKGKEEAAAQVVWGFYANSRGMVTPEQLADPNTWYAAATLIRAKESGYKMPQVSSINPVSPTHTELPHSARPQQSSKDEDVELEEAQRKMAKDLGFSVDEMKEIVREERKERRRREG